MSNEQPNSVGAQRTWFQFDTRALLAFTAVLAVGLGIWRLAGPGGFAFLGALVVLLLLTILFLLTVARGRQPIIAGGAFGVLLAGLYTTLFAFLASGPLPVENVAWLTLPGLTMGLAGGVCFWLRQREKMKSNRIGLKTRSGRRGRLLFYLAMLGLCVVAFAAGRVAERRKWTTHGSDCQRYGTDRDGVEVREFWGCGIGDRRLGSYLGDVPRTQRLRLSFHYTQVTDEGIRCLHEYSGLEEVDLRGTKVSEEGVRRLQEALPNCTIRW